MRPIHFPEANTTFHKPATMSDEQCLPVSAYAAHAPDGNLFVMTCWMPSYEDLQALNAGRPLLLQIFGGMPPVAMYTNDAQGEANL